MILVPFLVVTSAILAIAWLVAELRSDAAMRITLGCALIVSTTSAMWALKDLANRVHDFWVTMALREVSTQLKARNEATIQPAIERYLNRVQHDPSSMAAHELIRELVSVGKAAKLEASSSDGVVARSCLAPAKMAIGGIRWADSRDEVISRLGEPRSVTVDEELATESLAYPSLRIDIAGGHVLLVTALDAAATTTDGVHVGMPRAEVWKALGIAEPEATASEVHFGNCEIESYLAIEFTDGAVSGLNAGNDLP